MVTVRAVQRRLEQELVAQTDALEAQLLSWTQTQDKSASAETREKVVEEVTQKMQSLGDYVTATWRDLLPELITTYRDGYIVTGRDEVYVSIKKMFYPKWWLHKIGYFSGHGNPEAQNDDPNNWIYFSSGPNGAGSGVAAGWMALSLLTVLLAGGLGYFLGHQHAVKKNGTSSASSTFSIPSTVISKSVGSSGSYSLVSRVEERDEDTLLDDQERAIFTLNKQIIQGHQSRKNSNKSNRKEQEMSSFSYQSL